MKEEHDFLAAERVENCTVCGGKVTPLILHECQHEELSGIALYGRVLTKTAAELFINSGKFPDWVL
jgi:hypothetical protein